jgi:predicted SprT family Zn-dependent metalloprotease
MSRVGLVVRNNAEQTAVNMCIEAHKWLNTKFGVDTKLTFSREVNWGNDVFYAGFYRDANKEIRINIRNLYGNSIKDILAVLGHEIRHAIQHKKDWLEKGYSSKGGDGKWESGNWKGKSYWGEYWTAPWEIDAREYQYKYADMTIKALGFEKDADTKLPYGSVTIKLKDETIDAFLKKNKSKTIQLLRAYDKRKKSNPNGFWWLDLKQTKYKEWNRETINDAYKKYAKFMEIQFVPYKTKKEKFGGFSLDDLRF